MKPHDLTKTSEIQPNVKAAINLHQKGDVKNALSLYKLALKGPNPPIAAFINASSILRQDNVDEAIKILERGIKLYPNEPGPWNNLGNCFLDNSLLPKAIVAYRQALLLNPSLIDSRISLVSCLGKLGHPHLAYTIIRKGYKYAKTSNEQDRLALPLVETLLALPEEIRGDLDKLYKITEQIEEQLRSKASDKDPTRGGISVASMWINLGEWDRAIDTRNKIIKDTEMFLKDNPEMSLKKAFQSSWHMLSWNLAIHLLKQGNFKEGWRLYEHGLQVSAAGPQRWQRALKKPFRPSEVQFWKGESLKDKRLLLLGEQGIGDSMMFASLIPRLQQEGAEISFLSGERLQEIYRRSMPDIKIVSREDLREKILTPKDFDMQVPIGSICQYRFHELDDYCPMSPVLKANSSQVKELRSKYSDGRPLIGVSWQGGGKPNRIKLKSIGLKQLAPHLRREEFRFVSLQYGDDGPHLKRFKKATGIDVLHDESINPLTDMDSWLSQVAAMDAVLSIANTTVHGSGGLGVPTLCLVSNKSDWRWIEPDIYKGNYWYSSVEACYQTKDGSWSEALNYITVWLNQQLKTKV